MSEPEMKLKWCCECAGTGFVSDQGPGRKGAEYEYCECTPNKRVSAAKQLADMRAQHTRDMAVAAEKHRVEMKAVRKELKSANKGAECNSRVSVALAGQLAARNMTPSELDSVNAFFEKQLDKAPCWRPIDTAPRDGELILLYGLIGRVTAYWSAKDDDWCYMDDDYKPTHFRPVKWMPLPEPPKLAQPMQFNCPPFGLESSQSGNSLSGGTAEFDTDQQQRDQTKP